MNAEAFHQHCWDLLPWLANDRLSGAERAQVEEHVRGCVPCTRELATQRLICRVLAEPERVTYAPAPSFRALLERIDGGSSREPLPARTEARRPVVSRRRPRLPALAWAASVLLFVGATALVAISYRWSQPLYSTHTETAAAASGVLHVAFAPSVSIGEVSALLRSVDARMVDGPDESGVFGVSPEPSWRTSSDRNASLQLRDLAAHLRSDARVRWVEPVTGGDQPLQRLPPGS
jgi:hypothetical protein